MSWKFGDLMWYADEHSKYSPLSTYFHYYFCYKSPISPKQIATPWTSGCYFLSCPKYKYTYLESSQRSSLLWWILTLKFINQTHQFLSLPPFSCVFDLIHKNIQQRLGEYFLNPSWLSLTTSSSKTFNKLEQKFKLLGLRSVMLEHLHEIHEKFPYLIQLSQKNRSQLWRISDNLMKETAEIRPFNIRQHFFQCFRRLVFWVFRCYQIFQMSVILGQTFLNNLVQIVKN